MVDVVPKLIYWLPAYGATLAQGVGQTLVRAGVDVAGRETRGAFHALAFEQQVEVVKNDLLQHAWRRDGCVIAQGYGAYLFLHVQLHLLAFPGRLLLISPLMGCLPHEVESLSYRLPPQPSEILERASAGAFAFGERCTWLVGEHDRTAPVEYVRQLADQVRQEPEVIKGEGHTINANWLDWRVSEWLAEQGVSLADDHADG